jgi:hypothetical protein
MKRDFVVDPQFRALIPPLSPEEREQLTENLRTEGCRDALVVGHIEGRQILLDGHNRYDICVGEGRGAKGGNAGAAALRVRDGGLPS